ncbi:SDR family NAD(P)-dependent oxidoreductase [Sphingomonas sp.]|uniref:SDR family NAD(P)-dependent oxidoreductase n=1 Tax=Sphingomonas sp. TaxID=28214 RepID=UPI001EB26B57|nr:SDR family NAD(P)-dependent oxidoreductase [Sphingomonas sp.]MBX3595035.1 SDR family NAD(P)-dependent oxidoreductase [Sphingomonas sp.]
MTGTRLLDGRVALVTGAGGGLGRAHALALARHGARLVVNDYGPTIDGAGADAGASAKVADEIVAAGGEAVADTGDVGNWADAEAMIATAIRRFGRLDILVNNAGILRPRTLVGMSEIDAASVIRVHLMGTFATTHFAAMHWRERFKSDGVRGGRLINTTSAAGLFGFAQANYAAAKAGIAALTAVAATELAGYGVTANAIAPVALTRMSEGIAPETHTPDHAAQLVCWLASDRADACTGRVFNIGGGHVSVVDRWHTGPAIDKEGLWTVDQLDAELPALLAAAQPVPDVLGYYPDEPRSALLPTIHVPRGDAQAPSGGSR